MTAAAMPASSSCRRWRRNRASMADGPRPYPPPRAGEGSLPPLPLAGEGRGGGVSTGKLLANLMYFARTLRAAGMPVGPGRLLMAVEAVRAVGIERRDDLYWTLFAVFVNRQDQRPVFDQAFHIFWRNPRFLERALSLLLPQTKVAADDHVTLIRRLADALGERAGAGPAEREQRIEIDAALTVSAREVLQKQDFEQMSADELDAAKSAIKRLTLPLGEIRTRRFEADRNGARIDMRATLRAAARNGADTI